jgi:hypothetical protein
VLARLEQALDSVVGSVDDEIVTDSQLEFAVWDRVKIAGPLDGNTWTRFCLRRSCRKV